MSDNPYYPGSILWHWYNFSAWAEQVPARFSAWLQAAAFEFRVYGVALRDVVADSTRTIWEEWGPILGTRAGAGAAVMKVAGVIGITLPAAMRNELTTVLMLLALTAGFVLAVIGRKNAAGPIITARDKDAWEAQHRSMVTAAGAKENVDALVADSMARLQSATEAAAIIEARREREAATYAPQSPPPAPPPLRRQPPSDPGFTAAHRPITHRAAGLVNVTSPVKPRRGRPPANKGPAR
ncbi:MAG: magnesium transporter [Patescibacteria group bacterium]|nr:magnesium transporter [Patescibacteria group bacterium]